MQDTHTFNLAASGSKEQRMEDLRSVRATRPGDANSEQLPKPHPKLVEALRGLMYRAGDPPMIQQTYAGQEILSWESTADQPTLALPCELRAGWVQVRFNVESASKRAIQIYLDTGGEFNSAEVLTIQPDQKSYIADRSWYIPKSVHAIRLTPTDNSEPVRIRNFSIRSLTTTGFYSRAMFQVLRQAAQQKKLLAMVRKGAKALATGDIKRITKYVRGRRQLSGIDSTYDYASWIEKHKITPAQRKQMSREFERWTCPPKISLLLAAQDPTPAALRSSLDSVCRQIYPHWELIVVASPRLGQAARAVLNQYVRLNERITLHSLPTDAPEADALNHALDHATGDFTTVLTPGDEIAEHSMFQVAREICNHSKVDWIYSDEDRLNSVNQRTMPFFKPDWSPELALSSMYTGQLSAYRTSLLRTVGGWRSAYEGAHHYDLALRAMTSTDNIRHLADVLYHVREQSAESSSPAQSESRAQATRNAVEDYCRRTGLEATVEPTGVTGYHRVRRAVRGNPLVSVVIPTASQGADLHGSYTWFVLNCIKSIRERSTYKNIEIIVVDNNDMPRVLSQALKPYGVTQISYTRQFNLSAKMNQGAAQAKGDYVVFMNDDIEILTPDWVEGMLEHAQHRQVGAVGVKLLFPNDHLQHAGVIWTQFGPDHLFYDEKSTGLERYQPARFPRELMAVTGACVMVKTEDHHLIGGWNEVLPLNFNDIDLCLKLIDRGRRNVYTPYVEMRHYESASKSNDEKVEANIQRECKVFMDLWRGKHPTDPYYNPNFIPARAFYRIDSVA